MMQPDELPENLILQVDDLNKECLTAILFIELNEADAANIDSHFLVATLIWSIPSWWLPGYMSIDGLRIFEIYSES
jgi:hypothetical protein